GGAGAAEPYAQALMTPSRASRRAAASAAAISTTRRPPPSSGTRMMMLRPSSTTSSGPSPVRGFVAAMACLLDGVVALLWHPRTGPRATRVRWPLSQVLRPTRTMTPLASRRKRYPLPRTAPGDLHEHHCDDCRDQQQKEHHRADRGRSEEHTSELQSRFDLVCRLLLEKKKLLQSNYTHKLRSDQRTH